MGILLRVDRVDDFRDRWLTLSVEAYVELRERKDEEAEEEEMVLDLELFPKIELLFICSVYARMRSGEGGPSMAGSRDSDDEHCSILGAARGMSFLEDFFVELTVYTEGYAAFPVLLKLNIVLERLLQASLLDARVTATGWWWGYILSLYAARRGIPTVHILTMRENWC